MGVRRVQVRIAGLAAVMLCVATTCLAQFTSTGKASLDTFYSENGRYRLTSVPFDRYFPSPRGRSAVFLVGRQTPLYSVPRPFHEGVDRTFVSNDGRVILSVSDAFADENSEHMRSIMVYRDGAVVARYTRSEVTGCSPRDDGCSLVYWNPGAVDINRSGIGATYRKVFNEGVTEEERFLSDFPVFASSDSVYLVDSRRMVHTFSLVDGARTATEPFTAAYPRLKRIARSARSESVEFSIPESINQLRLADGRDVGVALGTVLGLKPESSRDSSFRFSVVHAEGTLSRDGSFMVERLRVDEPIDREKVRAFFATTRFAVSRIPAPCDRWYFDFEVFIFRNPDDAAARRERQLELTADRINGVYIPKDLAECFAELDKRINAEDKATMAALAQKEFAVQYHHTLGMGLRNGWGLWAGSRLRTYFVARGVRSADEMSGIILDYYHRWLNGDREGWKAWEREFPPTTLKKD